jgi:uncharacterized protein (PEP-CTERM system associated)
VIALVADPAAAGEWTIEPRFSVSETYTDNVRLAEKGLEEEDYVTVASPGIALHGTGRRVQLNLDYSLDYFSFVNQSSEDEFRNQLTATGLAELVEERLFIDAQASVSEEIVDNTDEISASEFNVTDNRRTLQVYNVSPFTLHRFGSWADGEARHRFSWFDGDDGSIGTSARNESSLSLTSGTRFTNLGWALNGSYERLGRDDGTDANTITGIGEVNYQFNSVLGTFFQVGYEAFDDDTLGGDPDGIFFEGGFRLTPGRRTELVVSYGDRFDSNDLEVEFRYEISSRTLFTARFSESITTSQAILANRLADIDFDGRDREGGFVSDRDRGDFRSGDPAFGLTGSAFRQELLEATLAGSRGRNTFSFRAFLERRKEGGNGTRERVMGGSVNFGRSLSRQSTLNFAASYEYFDFSGGLLGGREDELRSVDVSYSYSISENFVGSLTYAFNQRLSNQLAGIEFTENAVTIRFTKTF